MRRLPASAERLAILAPEVPFGVGKLERRRASALRAQ